MKATKCSLDGILLIEPEIYNDDRGFFLESFEEQRYRELGITDEFVQENHSRSARNVLRGMHFTRKNPQAQIVTVMRGKIFDVVVDVRKDSPTFGKWMGIELSDEGPRQIYMAHGFAHGFCVLSEFVDLHYKVSQRYTPNDDGGLRWNDPDVGINWPVDRPIISERDRNHPFFQNAFPL
jgi:dTDP-4-dehydrorhamnose 3,5-epimerase